MIALAIIFGLILIKTTLAPLLPAVLRQWDLLLPFIIYFGQRRSFTEGFVLCVVSSHLYSLCSTAPIGVFMLYYLVVLLLARSVSHLLYADRSSSILGLMFGFTLLGRMILFTVSSLFGHHWGVLLELQGIAPAVLLNTAMGYVVYRFLDFVDYLTEKKAVARIQLLGHG